MEIQNKIINNLGDFIFFLSILFFTVGLNFQDNPPNGWYQQWLPDLNGRQITDITFLDSLTGYAVTNSLAPGDTGYILKTTNGGDNWNFSFIINRGFTAIGFINSNTGYACGGSGGGTTYLCKTTNAGLNWFLVNSPSAEKWDDMYVLNEDTLWLVEEESLTGGVFRTTNGGQNWTQQLNLGSLNPTHIYFYNKDIGYISSNIVPYVRKTTDGGISWSVIINEGFRDLYFIDSLTGWRANDYMKKTTDGGLNWVEQTLPQGGISHTVFSAIRKFSNVGRDTIWGVYGRVGYPNFQWRGILLRTTDGGDNWLYQIPDTSIHSSRYKHVQFVDELKGWAYWTGGGIHTITGGDTTFYSDINKISTEIPKNFMLYQNYPNPFNPATEIIFEIKKTTDIKLKVFDINGREIAELINKKLKPGSYKYRFNGSRLSSGIYFYSLIAEGKIVDTKKMLLIK